MSTATSQDLLIDLSGGVARLTLNRPERRNALNEGLLERLAAALAYIANANDVRVVVVAAAGPVFCSGHDLTEMVGRSQREYHDLFALCSGVMLQLRSLPQPVIARVQGTATAAGCQLVSACDLAVAAETATFATPGVKIGLFCTTPMVPLVRAIPARPALEMLLTGEPISAARAYELGLVNRVVPAEGLDAALAELIDPIVAASPMVIRLGKAAFYEQVLLDEHTAYDRATDIMADNAVRDDAQEGITAFLEKRPARWQTPQTESFVP
ncbi:MAG TPA: enoyl-CoA hydratase [Pirellulales bacterium]|nr:enoyl-CoA hydratase [Pirellulales bacterium]